MPQSAQAAERTLQDGWLKQQILIFSQPWRLDVQDQSAVRADFWWDLSPQVADGAFSLMVSLLIRIQVLWNQGPTFITSNLITS